MNLKSKLLHIALFVGIATSLQARAASQEGTKEPATATRAEASCNTGPSRKSEEKAKRASKQDEIFWKNLSQSGS